MAPKLFSLISKNRFTCSILYSLNDAGSLWRHSTEGVNMSHNIVYNLYQHGCLSYHIWWTDASSSSPPRLQPSSEPHRARGWLSSAQWQHRRWQDQAPVWRLIAIHSAKGDFTHLLGDGKVEPELSPSSEASLEKRVRFKYFEARRLGLLQRRKVWTSPWRHIGFERHQSLTVKRADLAYEERGVW